MLGGARHHRRGSFKLLAGSLVWRHTVDGQISLTISPCESSKRVSSGSNDLGWYNSSLGCQFYSFGSWLGARIRCWFFGCDIFGGASPRLDWHYLLELFFKWGFLCKLINSYYKMLISLAYKYFPWRRVCKSLIPSTVNFFVRTVALGKILMIDNLRKCCLVLLDWCCMCKANGESIDLLFLHCSIVRDL